jgi:hydroxymethylpyrimidine/phosphomethylpyrimidine kinase
VKSVLTVAGSDPTGGAGLQADLKVIRAFGVHGLSVPAALTAQNTLGVNGVLPVERSFFLLQIESLLKDVRPDAVKAGMLYSAEIADSLSQAIKDYALENLVTDPVTVSSSGASLAHNGALDRIRDVLFPLSTVITPNIYEAAVLTGVFIEDERDMEKAARELKRMGPQVVVITGGHLEQVTIDVFFDGNEMQRIETKKIPGEYHGTGCAFSTAIASSLALGRTPVESVRKAKEFVTEAVRKAYHIGKGMGILQI